MPQAAQQISPTEDHDHSTSEVDIDEVQPRLRSKKRAKPSSTRRIFRPATVALLLLAVSAITAVAVVQSALLGLSGERAANASWLIPVSTGALSLVVLVVSFVHAIRKDADLASRHRQLAQRMEALEDWSWELRESEDHYRSLAEAFGDLVLFRNSEGELTFANRAARAALGNQIEQVFEQIQITSRWERPADGSSDQCAQVCLDIAGEKRWFEWLELPATDPVAGTPGIRSVARDVTFRRKQTQLMAEAREASESANRAKSQFLASVSHEIRTPLNGILGFTNLLNQTALNAEQRNHVATIEKSGESLLALIEDLLDLTKIEAGHLDLHPSDVSLVDLAEEVVELLAPGQAAGTGRRAVSLATYVDRRLPDQVKIDRHRLRQVLINLVSNALKFTDAGAIALRIEAVKDEPQRCRISVIDTGRGIDDEDQERIFNEFAQSRTEDASQLGGMGLGLAISRRIVSAMGGELTVTSKIGKGSSFSFEITLLPSDQTNSGSNNTAANAPLSGHTVVLAISDTPARTAIADTARDLGAVVLDSETELTAGATNVSVIATGHDGAAGTNDNRRRIFLTSTGEEKLFEADDFWLTLPVRRETLHNVLLGRKRAQNAQATPSNHNQTAAEENLTGRVLVVDDNDINAMLLEAQLEKSGFKTSRARDGQQAVDTLRSAGSKHNNGFDLVLMDLHMPVKDGLAATSEIRRLEKQNSSPAVPILILSADDQQSTRDAVAECGASDFMSKPVDLDRLQDFVAGLAKQEDRQSH
ncbi:MAG: ATP-binding protein [Pseudomonadota bacterium]